MNKRVRRFFLQLFSVLQIITLSLQPTALVPALLLAPVAVKAQQEVELSALYLSFDANKHEFTIVVKANQALPYTLVYTDESRDPVVSQATEGTLNEFEPGAYRATVYAGTCSGEVCTPAVVNSGSLILGNVYKTEYRIVDGVVVLSNPLNEAEEVVPNKVCLAEGDERLTAGDTLWTIDSTGEIAETKTAVKLGVAYQLPFDQAVSVTFTCLPGDESLRTPIKIQRVLTSDLALPDSDTQKYSKYAYDITTDMANGTFEYELTLPKENLDNPALLYIEKSVEEAQKEIVESELKEVSSELIGQSETNLSVVDLDHFTLFLLIDGSSLPNNWSLWQNYYDSDGNLVSDFEDNFFGLNDESNGGANVAPTEIDIASAVEFSGINAGYQSSLQYYYETNSTPESCTDDTLFLRMRLEGNPQASGGSGALYTTYHWDFLIDTNADGVSDYVVDIFGGKTNSFSTTQGGQKGSIGLYPNDAGQTTYSPAAVLWTQRADNQSNDFTQLEKEDYNDSDSNNDQFWLEAAVPLSAHSSFSSALCNQTNLDGQLFASTSTSNTDPLQKDWMNPVGFFTSHVEHKTVTNLTNPGATTSQNPAQPGDVLLYTLTVTNDGTRVIPGFVISDDISDILEYATVLNADADGNGLDGTLSPMDIIAWPQQDIALGETLSEQFTVTIKPSDQWPNSDMVLTNIYGDTVSVYVPSLTPTPTPSTTNTPSPTPTATPTSTPTATPTSTPTATPTNTPTATPTPTNTPTPAPAVGKIVIEKQTEPDGDPQDFTFTPSYGADFNLSDGESNTSVDLSPGTYTVTETITNSDWRLTSLVCDDQNSSVDVPNATTTVNLEAGETVTCVFTNTKLATIGGYKIHDKNADGVQAGGNPLVDIPMSNWKMYLFDSLAPGSQPIASALTNTYRLPNSMYPEYIFKVVPGTYYVCEELQADWFQSFPTSGPTYQGKYCRQIDVTEPRYYGGNNFLNYTYGTLKVRKMNDLNGNGLSDSGDSYVEGWEFFIDENGNKILDSGETSATTQMTNLIPQPEAIFSVKPGQHVVCEVHQNGWIQTWPTGNECSLSPTVVSGGTTLLSPFFNFQYGKISGYKFHDVDGDGQRGASEAGLAGWTIFIDANNNGLLGAGERSTVTDANGYYEFDDLTAGTYRIREVQEAGWLQTSTNPTSITVQSGTNATNINFGNQELYVTLAVTKTDDPDPVYAGQSITYTIDWSVTGNTPANNLFLHDFPDWPLELVLADNPGWEVYGSGYRYALGSPTPPATGSATVVLSVPSDYTGSGVNNDVKLVVDDPQNPGQTKYVEASQPTEVLYCGDGLINGQEQCDDGNSSDGDGCSASCQFEPVTILASKVVCDSEADLPNWGDDAGGQVTATTAQDYVDQSNGRCRLAEDWDFEWGYDGSAPKQSGEYVGYAGDPWTEFNVKTSTASPAAALIDNPDGKTLWFREVLQDGYIPFSYPPDASPGSNVSAEFYCHTDHYKYDNYESIPNAQPGSTYYCVAFNAPATNDVEICKVDNQDKAQPGWTVGLAKQTPEFSDVIPVTSGAGVDASLPAGDHVVFASGTYRYGSSAMIADAGFSYRPLSIPMGADGWVSGDQLTTVGGLELKVGGQNIAWGGYNPTHQYTTLVSGFAGGDLSLNIWDNQYSDNLNNGNFRAQIHQVITTGVTEDDGCVTLEDVPYGDYVAFELPQDNWSHVSTMVNGQNVDAFPAPITVGESDSLVTFENRLVTGQVRVQKTTDPAGDPTVFNVTATGGGQVFGSATGSVTDATDYTYTVEPQTYSVSEDVPEGWELTSNNCSNLLVPSDGERVCQISNTKLYDIHGYKWNDVNRNAVNDREEMLPGWEIFIDQNDNQQWDDGEPKTTTSSDPDHLGWYWFENLYAGTYEVCEILQDGWAQTYPVDPNCHTVTLPDSNPAGRAVSENMVVGPEYNFGNAQNARFSAFKFADNNLNAVFDGAEEVLGNWTIFIDENANGQLDASEDSRVTNDDPLSSEFGTVSFDGIYPGEYSVCEVEQAGWRRTAPVDSNCQSINLQAGDGYITGQPNLAFGNVHLGDITVYKYEDFNIDGTWQESESLLSEWEMVLSQSELKMSELTDASGSANFVVVPGEYVLSETMQEGWVQSGMYCEVVEPSITPTPTIPDDRSPAVQQIENDEEQPSDNAYQLTVNPGDTVNCYVGNYQTGTVTGAKYFDANQDGEFTEGEDGISDWGIELTGNEATQSATTSTAGQYDFTNLTAGTYTVCEEDRTNLGWVSTEPDGQLCQQVSITQSGQVVAANFGNYINSELFISKSNNAWPVDKKLGEEVTYTIQLLAQDGPVYNVEVTDLFPDQFDYVAGSYTADSSTGRDLKAEGVVPEPVYSSPGTWQVGDLEKDEIVTLTYRAKVSNSTDPGIYPDAAFAAATSAQENEMGTGGQDLQAISDPEVSATSESTDFDGQDGHIGERTFVGTQVAVVVDQTPSNDWEVAREEEKTQGSVLGASTELPATGARAWITFLAVMAMMAGLALVLRSRRNRTTALVVAMAIGIGSYLATPVSALTIVRIEQPYNTSAEVDQVATTNQQNVKVDFVVLSQSNVTPLAQCQQRKDGGEWTNLATMYTAKAGGNSGYCDAKDLSNQSTYDFRVRVTGDGPEQFSSLVSVGLKTDAPGTPTGYSKERLNGCIDRIRFTTANDSRTSRVEIYRSDNAEKFTANSGSRAHSIGIGPNQSYTLDSARPDCQVQYFYVLRAFDDIGNASGLIGDTEVTTVIIETTGGTSQTVTVGAIPVGTGTTTGQIGGGAAVGAGTGGATTEGTTEEEEAAATTEDEELANAEDATTDQAGQEEEGEVLGAATGGGILGWLSSIWQWIVTFIKSLFGMT